ncbi:MAG: restriction endonuclease subunit S [Euryarchaeota archaeon]|nr:restriction endonuclease subunit S [Euryarchaeota archaeon]MBU4340130.1 restriction endonuclease subunit S [Euryarchaeota archaeon]MCG2737472.1 restriction endonuclease subunit S [Candidatus Methanoperedenaceae archaeon]
MKPETFFDNFEVLADAPNGVQKLRELILQLAVRGKLVAQDEKDEPASVLLKNIKANQIKTSYNPVEKYEMPYDLPKKWEWMRLGEILALEYGDSLPSSKRSENGKYPVYGSNGIVGYHDKFLIDKPSIIVGRKGSCGALNICLEPSWPTDVSYFIIPPAEIDLKFAYILLKSLNLEKLGKGIKPGLNRNEAYLLVTSLPPFKEQLRIVAKVNQLMSLCDELEARQQKKRETRAHLNSAALDRLLAARAPGEFAEGWRRIKDNFDLLYDAPENVGKLKQAILQLAVMGKLVEQDEKDEPASVLLEQINKEKERIVNEGRIKLIKTSPIKNDELAFELPKNWEGTRLGNITIKLGAGSTPLGCRSVYDKTGIVSPSN